jgi:hypothetical protein
VGFFFLLLKDGFVIVVVSRPELFGSIAGLV